MGIGAERECPREADTLSHRTPPPLRGGRASDRAGAVAPANATRGDGPASVNGALGLSGVKTLADGGDTVFRLGGPIGHDLCTHALWFPVRFERVGGGRRAPFRGDVPSKPFQGAPLSHG